MDRRESVCTPPPANDDDETWRNIKGRGIGRTNKQASDQARVCLCVTFDMGLCKAHYGCGRCLLSLVAASEMSRLFAQEASRCRDRPSSAPNSTCVSSLLFDDDWSRSWRELSSPLLFDV